jgi:hypothetical protein
MTNITSSTSRTSKNWPETYGWEGIAFEQVLAIAGCTGEGIERLKPKNTTPALEAAMGYAIFFNWEVFPADVEEKKSYLSAEYAPGHKPWGMTSDPQQLQRNFVNLKWRLMCGVGVPTGWVNRIFDIEADTKKGHGVDGLASIKALEAKHGKLPDTLMAESPSGSIHRIYKHPGRGIKIKTSDSEIAPGVDIRGDGGMFVAPPSVRKDGVYRWLNNLPIADAPQWLLDLVCADAPAQDNSSSGEKNWAERYADELHEPVPLDKLAFMMRVIPNDYYPNDSEGWSAWNDVGMALWDAQPNDDGLALFDAWSRKSAKYNEKDTKEKWKKYLKNPPTKLTVGKLFYLTDEADPDWRSKYEAERMAAELAEAKQEKKKKLPLVVELGSKLWGAAVVVGKEYRFGADQSKVIDPGKGVWFDFTTNKGGGLKDLMRKVEIANRRQSNVDDVVTVCASDVVMRPMDWIWPGHLLRGSQELMSGLPDLCKSQVQIGYIACATARKRWPTVRPPSSR